MILTREQVIEVLAQHGLTADTQTAYCPETREVMGYGSSFDENVGRKESYTKKEVFDWLGY